MRLLHRVKTNIFMVMLIVTLFYLSLWKENTRLCLIIQIAYRFNLKDLRDFKILKNSNQWEMNLKLATR